jgi:hypothetical protein
MLCCREACTLVLLVPPGSGAAQQMIRRCVWACDEQALPWALLMTSILPAVYVPTALLSVQCGQDWCVLQGLPWLQLGMVTTAHVARDRCKIGFLVLGIVASLLLVYIMFG